MKTINNLIDKIVDLKIELHKLDNKYNHLSNEWKASKDIICNLKKELTDLRIILQETNNK